MPKYEPVIELAEKILGGMKSGAWERELRHLPSGLRNLIDTAMLPAVLESFLVALALLTALFLVVVGTHLALLRMRRPAGRAFISYQHDRDAVADEIALAMRGAGLNPIKLPYQEHPDMDDVLDRIRDSIRESDVFVCVPGKRASFVESEVAMAFGLGKPLLFIVADDDNPRLPGTAKSGHPIFSLDSLRREGMRPFLDFCSFLSGDWRSTLRLHGAVLDHVRASASLIFLTYFVAIGAMSKFLQLGHDLNRSSASSPADMSAVVVMWFLGIGLVFLVAPYALFVRMRFAVLANVKRSISSRKFADSVLPETIGLGLTKSRLQSVLFGSPRDGAVSRDEPAIAGPAQPRVWGWQGLRRHWNGLTKGGRIKLVASVAFFAVCAVVLELAAQATARDWKDCGVEAPAADACTRLIEIGDVKGRDLALAHKNRGIAYLQAGDLQKAWADYEEAIQIDPGFAEAISNEGNVLSASGDMKGALAKYDGALALKPQLEAARYNRAITLTALKRYKEAILEFGRLLAARPNFVAAVVGRANAFYLGGGYPQAIQGYDTALRLAPGSADIYENRGHARQITGDTAGARDDLARAQALRGRR